MERNSNKPELLKKFFEILLRKKAIIFLSWASFYELGRLNDMDQIKNIQQFVKPIDWSTIKCVLWPDILNHSKIEEQSPCIKPEAYFDEELFQLIIRSLNSLPFTLPNVIEKFLQNPIEKKEVCDYWAEKTKELNDGISDLKNDTEKVSDLKKKWKKSASFIRTTNLKCIEILASMCLAYIVSVDSDNSKPMEPKEWIDVCHLLAPVAYLKFVLMDSRWTTFISQSALKPPKIAKTYNKNGLNLFLNDLNAY